MSIGRNESKVVIVHGSQATPEDNWFPWRAAALRSDGVRVIAPKFPTPKGLSS